MKVPGERLFLPLPGGIRDTVAAAVLLSAAAHAGAILWTISGGPDREIAFDAGSAAVIEVVLIEGPTEGAAAAAGGKPTKEPAHSTTPAAPATLASKAEPEAKARLPDRAANADRVPPADTSKVGDTAVAHSPAAEAAPVPPPKPSPPAPVEPAAALTPEVVPPNEEMAQAPVQIGSAPAVGPGLEATSKTDSAGGGRMSGSTGGEAQGAAPHADNPAPPYPFAARRRGQEGRVLLQVEVLPSGDAGIVRIEKSSGVASLDEAASEAVRRWRFHPARHNGRPVPATVQVPIRFALK